MSATKKIIACNNSKAVAFDTIVNKVLAYENEKHMRKMANLRNEVII